jgi:hypothetical protein
MLLLLLSGLKAKSQRQKQRGEMIQHMADLGIECRSKCARINLYW